MIAHRIGSSARRLPPRDLWVTLAPPRPQPARAGGPPPPPPPRGAPGGAPPPPLVDPRGVLGNHVFVRDPPPPQAAGGGARAGRGGTNILPPPLPGDPQAARHHAG